MSNIKILAIHNGYSPDQTKRQGTELWRLTRPLEELAKHVDWQIDHRASIVPENAADKGKKDFTEAEMEAAYKEVCKYDIVISSYQANPTMYTLLKVAADKAGVQYIMDCDDDLFAINEDNPVWLKLTDQQVFMMQRMLADNTWITTTAEPLAKVFRDRRLDKEKSSVTVIPNFITDAYQAVPPHNGEKVVIGFFGGSSHYGDVHETGFLPALEKVMHEHKNVYFKSIGMPIKHSLPKARVEIVEPQRGDAWLNDIYPNMQLDIAVGPLLDNQFNAGKSDIKWQEATRASSAFIASYVGPFKKLKPDTVVTVQNTQNSWYEALKRLVEDKDYRNQLVMNAQFTLEKTNTMENNWQHYQKLFERVYSYKCNFLQSQTKQSSNLLV